jgi:hypothetical protein
MAGRLLLVTLEAARVDAAHPVSARLSPVRAHRGRHGAPGPTISNSRAMTSEAGARPSTRPGWSTRLRARRAPGGSALRGQDPQGRQTR